MSAPRTPASKRRGKKVRRNVRRIDGIARLRADKRVELVDDERPLGGNIIVTMEPGWTLDPMDPHNGVFGADTLTEAWETLRSATFLEVVKQAA